MMETSKTTNVSTIFELLEIAVVFHVAETTPISQISENSSLHITVRFRK